jgi:hypothetical protein
VNAKNVSGRTRMVLPRAMKAVSLSLVESGSGQAVLGRQR